MCAREREERESERERVLNPDTPPLGCVCLCVCACVCLCLCAYVCNPYLCAWPGGKGPEGNVVVLEEEVLRERARARACEQERASEREKPSKSVKEVTKKLPKFSGSTVLKKSVPTMA